MSVIATETKNIITLQGSSQIVRDFFEFSVNKYYSLSKCSILYQRGIYPPESFDRVRKYGLSMVMTEDPGLKAYLKPVLEQVKDWLELGEIKSLILVISSSSSLEVLERWQFDVESDPKILSKEIENYIKPEDDIMKEIQAIIRQITSSVTFLPLLEEPCTFELLIYTSKECVIPKAWEESDPKYISKSEEVKLRNFTTKVHKVDTKVTYKSSI